jgi:excisionase family DNA binding protein
VAEHLFTVEEVAEYVHLSGKTVWREIRRGNLRARKICNRWLIDRTDVEVWLERGGNPSASTGAVDANVVPVPPDRGSLAALRQIESEAA